MHSFPVFLDLRGRKVLVVGHGEVAQRKGAPLHRAGAEVVFVDRFDPAELEGCALAIGAEASEADLLALSAGARARGIPVNVVDRPALCTCLMPAIVDRDPVTIAIGTGGAAPLLARLLRARIETAVPPLYGRLAALAARYGDRVRRAIPNPQLRRRVLERIFTGAAAEHVFAGNEDAAARAIEAELQSGASPAGSLHVLAGGPGEADLVTLRALRLLGEADVIVREHGAPPAVLALARRDAEVLEPRAGGQCRAEAMRQAEAGRRVVLLCSGDGVSLWQALLPEIRRRHIAASFVPAVPLAIAMPASGEADGEGAAVVSTCAGIAKSG